MILLSEEFLERLKKPIVSSCLKMILFSFPSQQEGVLAGEKDESDLAGFNQTLASFHEEHLLSALHD